MSRIGVPFRPGAGAVESVNGQTGDVDLSGTLVRVAGDTMTGSLILAGDASTDLEAVPKQQLDLLDQEVATLQSDLDAVEADKVSLAELTLLATSSLDPLDRMVVINDPTGTPAGVVVTIAQLANLLGFGQVVRTGSSIGFSSIAAINKTLTAGTMYLRPLSVRIGGAVGATSSGWRIGVNAAVASSTADKAVYVQNDLSSPTLTLVAPAPSGTTLWDTTGTGVKGAIGPYTLVAGRSYWVAVATAATGLSLNATNEGHILLPARNSSFAQNCAGMSATGWAGTWPGTLDLSTMTEESTTPQVKILCN